MTPGQTTVGPRAARIGWVALLLATSALASRLLGVARESVFAAYVGAGAEADAYRAAFLIPDMMNHFLAGGALSAAFIPFYTRRLQTSGQADAERLFAVVLGTLGMGVLGMTLLLWWQLDPLVALVYGSRGGFSPEIQDRVVSLTRILLPAQIFFIVGGVIRGVLMAHGRFASQAAAGILYNVGIIGGGYVGQRLGVGVDATAFAWGALAGALVGPFGAALLELLATRVARLRVRVAPLDGDFRAYLWLAAPLMLGLGMLTVDDWYDKFFGARVAEGAVAALGYARQLMLAPVGVIGQSIAIAALPTLSAMWSQRRLEELNRLVLTTLQSGIGLALLAGAACFVLAEPLVRVILERGRFDPENTTVVAQLVQVFSLAIPGWVLSQIAPRAFYAREEMWLPMWVSTAVAALMFPLYAALGTQYGSRGLAAAGAIGMTLSSITLLLVARRRHGGPSLRPLLESTLRSAIIAVGTAAIGAWIPVPAGTGLLGALLEVAIRSAAMGAIALLGVHWLGDPPTRAALARLVNRLRRALRL